ncbi:MAG: hypothetical protein V3R90_11540, partial [Limibaculum sp.]
MPRMGPVSRTIILAALFPLILAACADAPPVPTASEPARLQLVAFRLAVTGETGPVLETGTTGRIEVLREGADEVIGLDFENGELAIHELPPGRYSIARIGPLACRGLSFEVDPSAEVRALGSLRAEIIVTDYYVALLSGQAATGAEIAGLAERTGAAPGAIDARPLVIPEAAPCFVNRAGPDASWHDLPLGQKIMLGVVIAGFCAAA